MTRKVHVVRSRELIDRCCALGEEILTGCTFGELIKEDPERHRRFRLCLSGICAYYAGAVFHQKTAKEIMNRCAERSDDNDLYLIKKSFEKATDAVEALENRGLGTAVIAHKDQLLETAGIEAGEGDQLLVIKYMINFYVDLIKKAENSR